MKKIFFILILLSYLFASCSDWLDVKPKEQVEAEKMLSSVKGCNAAIGGIYYRLSKDILFGKEMTFGMMDVLARYWDVSSNPQHKYYHFYNNDYEDSATRTIIDNIYSELQICITECNRILLALNKDDNKLPYSDLMKGELYGLRAFLHGELLELYGPVILSNADYEKQSIAYKQEFSIQELTFSSVNKVLKLMEDDLLTALNLLKNDPIKEVGRTGDINESFLNYNEVLNRRGSRMNYYAVLGLLARLKLYENKKEDALKYAREIIAADNLFSLVDRTIIEGNMENNDVNYSREMVFSIYVNELYDYSTKQFQMEVYNPANESTPITEMCYSGIKNDLYGRIPDGGGTDIRLNYWFSEQLNSSGNHNFLKLKKALNTRPEVGVIRLSELYYIACESLIGVDNVTALDYLNHVREARKLEPIEVTDNNQLYYYLIHEMRKDFIGEGRMFGIYKRLYSLFKERDMKLIYLHKGEEYMPIPESLVLPIPEDVYEYSPNIKS